MDLKRWREKRETGDPVELPSGLVVTVKRVSLMDLALQGEIPTPLVAMVNRVMANGLDHVTVENVAEYEEPINLVVKAAITMPTVADTSSETTLGVRELPIIDRLAVFRYCNRYGEPLKPFRREQAPAVESAQSE